MKIREKNNKKKIEKTAYKEKYKKKRIKESRKRREFPRIFLELFRLDKKTLIKNREQKRFP